MRAVNHSSIIRIISVVLGIQSAYYVVTNFSFIFIAATKPELLEFFYLIKLIFSFLIFIGAISLFDFEEWGRKLVIVIMFLNILIDPIKDIAVFRFTPPPDWLLYTLASIIPILVVIYLNTKSVKNIFLSSGDDGQRQPQQINETNKKIGSYGVPSLLNVLLLSLTYLILILFIYKIIKNVNLIGGWCPNERLFLNSALVLLAAASISAIILLIFRKNKLLCKIFVLINLIILVGAFGASSFPGNAFNPDYTKSRAECLKKTF